MGRESDDNNQISKIITWNIFIRIDLNLKIFIHENIIRMDKQTTDIKEII